MPLGLRENMISVLGLGFRYAVLCAALVGCAACGARQPVRVFGELPSRLDPGHTVFVIDDTGAETRGSVVTLSRDAIVLSTSAGTRSFDAARIRQIQRYGDSLWNGALIGAAVAVPGVMIGDPPYRACPHDPSARCASTGAAIAQRAVGVAVMGAIGAGIDALMRSRQQVYLAPVPPSPSVGPGEKRTR